MILAIELDDRSHDRTSRRHRDAFLNKALAAVGIPWGRVRYFASQLAFDIAQRRMAVGPLIATFLAGAVLGGTIGWGIDHTFWARSNVFGWVGTIVGAVAALWALHRMALRVGA
jgi:F0F1-type ATP synthase assembly protein I